MDYIKQYIQDGQFDVPRLLHDDFYIAIKLCFNNQKYVSCAKLLVCFIDTLGFIKYGDTKDAFTKWLDDYANLEKVGINSSELWEHRNSLLHTTSLKSRKVLRGESPILILYVGTLPEGMGPPEGEKWYDLKLLMSEITQGLQKFIIDFISNNRELFIERYDLILSDHRYLKYEI